MRVAVEFIVTYRDGPQSSLHLKMDEKVSEETFVTEVLKSVEKERIKEIVKIAAARIRTSEEHKEMNANLEKFLCLQVIMDNFNNNLLNPKDRFLDLESIYQAVKTDRGNIYLIMNWMLATSGKYKYFQFLLARKGKYYLDSSINPRDEDVKKWEDLKNNYYESLGTNPQSAKKGLKTLKQNVGKCTTCKSNCPHDLQVDLLNELAVQFQFK
jgi:hypothetical protein